MNERIMKKDPFISVQVSLTKFKRSAVLQTYVSSLCMKKKISFIFVIIGNAFFFFFF